jgi:hypothetical protein
MRRVLPAWLTAMPWTLRSGDVWQIVTQNALGGIRAPPGNKEVDMTRHKFKVGQLMDFCSPRAGVTNGGPAVRDRSTSSHRGGRASVPREEQG